MRKGRDREMLIYLPALPQEWYGVSWPGVQGLHLLNGAVRSQLATRLGAAPPEYRGTESRRQVALCTSDE